MKVSGILIVLIWQSYIIPLSVFLDEVRKLLCSDWMFDHRANAEIRILGGFANIWFILAQILLFIKSIGHYM